jgi:hypothetical protein
VHDGVAHHVLEGRQHALEDLTIQLARAAVDAQFRELADFQRGLPHDAAQALCMLGERHHARAHEAVLQLGRHARLLHEQPLRVLRDVRHELLDAVEVAHGFGERTRELLYRRVAIELERVEILVARVRFVVAEADLCLGLELELAQLLAQARDGLRQLAEVEVDGAERRSSRA